MAVHSVTRIRSWSVLSVQEHPGKVRGCFFKTYSIFWQESSFDLAHQAPRQDSSLACYLSSAYSFCVCLFFFLDVFFIVLIGKWFVIKK